MTNYRTVDGDMVDAICQNHYGRKDMAEAVYAANPGLAAMGPVLAKGVTIHLPDAPSARPVAPVRLWT